MSTETPVTQASDRRQLLSIALTCDSLVPPKRIEAVLWLPKRRGEVSKTWPLDGGRLALGNLLDLQHTIYKAVYESLELQGRLWSD